MKVIVTGGGTGGHFFPAITIAKLLRSENIEVYFMGNSKGIEFKGCLRENVPFYDIPSKSTSKKNFNFVFQNSKGVLKAIAYMKNIKPDIIYSTGGFTTAPILAAAHLLKIPFIIHEQNAVIGLVNRLFRSRAQSVIHSFPFEQKPGEVFLGNISRYNEVVARTDEYVVFMGGSGGAAKINELAIKYAKQNPLKKVLLLAGRNYTLYEELPNLKILQFENDMLSVYSKAEFVVARAGSTTLSELAALSIPSIIIPMPNSADGHQQKNADYYEWKNAIIKVNQDEYVYETLCNAINRTSKKEKRNLVKNLSSCYDSSVERQIVSIILNKKTV